MKLESENQLDDFLETVWVEVSEYYPTLTKWKRLLREFSAVLEVIAGIQESERGPSIPSVTAFHGHGHLFLHPSPPAHLVI